MYVQQILIHVCPPVNIQQWVSTHYCWSGMAQQQSAEVPESLWKAFLKASIDCYDLIAPGRAFQSVTLWINRSAY